MSKKPTIINLEAAIKEKYRQQNDQDERDLSDGLETNGIQALVDIVEMICGAASMDEEFADFEKHLCDGLEAAAVAKVLWTTIDDVAMTLGRLGT